MARRSKKPKKQLDHTLFHPDRSHVLGAIVMALISLLMIGVDPARFTWILLFPALFIFWVFRSRTTVREEGVRVAYAFRPGKLIPWEELKGIRFGGLSAYAVTTAGKSVALPGVSFNSLPRLAQVSDGRIPDVITESREASHDKVMVISRDGRQVLKTPEEVERDKAAKQEAILSRKVVPQTVTGESSAKKNS